MQKKILEIEDIKRILPQRYPFLMIDRVIEASPEKVVAIKNVSANEDYFEGHFPEEKVMPGVLMIEAMAQAAIVLYREKFDNKKTVYLGTVEAKIIKPVRPGDQLRIEVVPKKMLEKMGLIHAEIFLNKEKVAQMTMGYGTKR